MDISILKTFLEVYRTCHFGKAANNLFVTQATVSARIQQLENELGVQLFKRDRNNIHLTPSGYKFLKHAESILNIWNRARLDISFREEGKTVFVIGAIPGLWDTYLVNLMEEIRKQFSDISIVAEALSADSLIRHLLDQSIDLAFTYDYPQFTDLRTATVPPFQLILVSSRKDASLATVFEDGYIYIDWGTSFASEHARHYPELTTPVLKFSLGHLAYDYIKRCGGSGYLPESMIRDDLQNDILFRVKGAPEIKCISFAVYSENSIHLDIADKVAHLTGRNMD